MCASLRSAVLDSRLGALWINVSRMSQNEVSFEPYCGSLTHVIPLEERLNVLITFRATNFQFESLAAFQI
jgi:hypothetical protein